MADLLAKLQEGLPPEQRKDALASTPDEIRAAAMKNNLAAAGQAKFVDKLYARTAIVAEKSQYTSNASVVWKAEKSRFLVEPGPRDKRTYEFYNVGRRVDGLAGGEALLLHAALIAKSRGAAGFVTMPARQYVFSSGIVFVNTDDQQMPRSVMFDPDTVIAAISQHIPSPEMQREALGHD